MTKPAKSTAGFNRTAILLGTLLGGALFPTISMAGEPSSILSDFHAVQATARRIGKSAVDRTISVDFVLNSRDAAGAATFVQHVMKVGDPLFHQFLTPKQYASQFGADPGRYRDIVAWAATNHLTIGEEYSSHLVIPLHGTIAAFEAALKVRFMDYKDAAGRTFYSASNAPSLLPAIAENLASIIGMSDEHHFEPLVRKLPPNVPVRNTGATGPNGGLTSSDIRSIYAIPEQPGQPRSETVALFEQGGFDSADVSVFQKFNKLPPTPVKCRSVNHAGCGVDYPGIELETVLDIDAVNSVNPSLGRILVYEDASDTFGAALVNVLSAIATDNAAQNVSISYGLSEDLQGEAAAQAENTVLTQLVAQGIGTFASTGDQGAYAQTLSGLHVEDPSSQPLVVAVGGTTLLPGAKQTYGQEIVWNELGSFPPGGTGGGVSTFWPLPQYQLSNGTSVALQNGGSATQRNVPDIAADADPATGLAIYSRLNGGWIVVGGTSLATPIWAGQASIIDATSKFFGFGQIGFLNPTLYRLNLSTTLLGLDFNDVVSGTNGDPLAFGVPGFYAGSGYDNTTGIGSFGASLYVDAAVLPAHLNLKPPAAPLDPALKTNGTDVSFSWRRAAGATGYAAVAVNLSSHTNAGLLKLAVTKDNTVVFANIVKSDTYAFVVFSLNTTGATKSIPIYLNH